MADVHYNLAFANHAARAADKPMNLTTLALLVLTPLLVWRIYSRLKTMMARQRSIIARHWTGLGVLCAMLLVVGSEVAPKPMLALWLALGSAAGVAYGVWGLKRSRFEDTPEGQFFTPDARLGILVAMLFVARLLYVGVDFYANQGTGAAPQKFTESELTLLAIGLLAGYFGTFCAGLLRWRHSLKK